MTRFEKMYEKTRRRLNYLCYRGYSFREMAKDIGVSKSTVHNFARGGRVSLETYEKIDIYVRYHMSRMRLGRENLSYIGKLCFKDWEAENYKDTQE